MQDFALYSLDWLTKAEGYKKSPLEVVLRQGFIN